MYFARNVIVALAGAIVLANDRENDKCVAFFGDKRLKGNQKTLARKRSFKMLFQPVKQTRIFVNAVLRRNHEKCFTTMHRPGPQGSLGSFGFEKQMVILVASQKSKEIHKYFVSATRHFGDSNRAACLRKSLGSVFFIS